MAGVQRDVQLVLALVAGEHGHRLPCQDEGQALHHQRVAEEHIGTSPSGPARATAVAEGQALKKQGAVPVAVF